MKEANKFKLGLFVIAALIVFITAISAMGLFDQLKPKARLVTFVEESVQGLTSGSPVKYKGVPIGNVDDISIITGSQLIRIDILIDLSKFRRKVDNSFNSDQPISKEQFYAYLTREAERGLTCRIEPDGITGVKYVEMDFFKDADKGVEKAKIENDIFYLPSTPSMMSNLRMSVFEILASIASIDFKSISAQLVTLLNTAEKTIKDSKVENLISRAGAVAEKLDLTVTNLNNSLTRKQLDKTMRDIDSTFESIRALSDQLNEAVQRSQFPQTANSIRELSASLRDNSASLQNSLLKANDAIDALTDLILYLNDNPASLIRGKGQSGPEK